MPSVSRIHGSSTSSIISAKRLHAQGKTGEAGAAYKRTITIVEKNFGPDELRLAEPLQQMAELKSKLETLETADELYQRALRIEESRLGTTDPSLAPLVDWIRRTAAKQDEPA